MPQDARPTNPQSDRARQLGAIVRAAIRRLVFCPEHDIRRETAAACPLCIVEAVARSRGRLVTLGSIERIMTAWPGGAR